MNKIKRTLIVEKRKFLVDRFKDERRGSLHQFCKIYGFKYQPMRIFFGNQFDEKYYYYFKYETAQEILSCVEDFLENYKQHQLVYHRKMVDKLQGELRTENKNHDIEDVPL